MSQVVALAQQLGDGQVGECGDAVNHECLQIVAIWYTATSIIHTSMANTTRTVSHTGDGRVSNLGASVHDERA